LPRRIRNVDFKGAFSYEPVNFTVQIGHLSLQAEDPSLTLRSLSGTVSTEGDDVHVKRLAARTAESSVELKGMVRNYLGTPDAALTLTSDRLTLREFEAFVPPLRGVDLHPAFEVSVSGALTKLRAELNVRRRGRLYSGRLAGDVMSPKRTLQERTPCGERRRLASIGAAAGYTRQWAGHVRSGDQRGPDDSRNDPGESAEYCRRRLLGRSPRRQREARRQSGEDRSQGECLRGTRHDQWHRCSPDCRAHIAVVRPDRPRRSDQRRETAALARRPANHPAT
jgi:hypothetical protein